MEDPGLEFRQGPDRLWGPSTLLLNWDQGIFLRRIGDGASGCGVKLTDHLNTVPR